MIWSSTRAACARVEITSDRDALTLILENLLARLLKEKKNQARPPAAKDKPPCAICYRGVDAASAGARTCGQIPV